MKRIITKKSYSISILSVEILIVTFMFLMSGCLFAEETGDFRNAHWEMTPHEVMSIERGRGSKLIKRDESTPGGLMLHYEVNLDLPKFSTSINCTVTYMFAKGSLFNGSYSMNHLTSQQKNALLETLKFNYGDPELVDWQDNTRVSYDWDTSTTGIRLTFDDSNLNTLAYMSLEFKKLIMDAVQELSKGDGR